MARERKKAKNEVNAYGIELQRWILLNRSDVDVVIVKRYRSMPEWKSSQCGVAGDLEKRQDEALENVMPVD